MAITRDNLQVYVDGISLLILGGSESRGGQVLLLIFTMLTVLLNVFLILLVLSSQTLRHSSKHLLILNVAIGDLLMGLLVCPLLLNIATSQTWSWSSHLYNTLTLLRTSLVPSVTCMGLFLVNLFYILRITTHNIHAPQKAGMVVPMSLGFCSWLVSIIVLVPLYFGATTSPGNATVVHQCSRVVNNETFAFIFITLSYIPQAFCVLASALLMVYVHTPGYLARNLLFYGEWIQVPLDAVLVSFITLACYTPFFIVEFASVNYECRNRVDCRLFHMGNQITIWLVLAKSFLVPLCWFACRDMRRAARCLCCG